MGTQNAEVGRDFEKPTLQLKKKKAHLKVEITIQYNI